MANSYALQALWLHPVTDEPIPDGVISVEGDRIVAVGENLSGQPPQQLGRVALLPALINAHTHLEFSDLAQPLGPAVGEAAGGTFPDWIRRVIAYRRQHAADQPAAKKQAIARGLEECEAADVAAVGEIATLPHNRLPYERGSQSVCGALFLELLGLGGEREKELIAAARNHLQQQTAPNRWQMGLSPHAPYTASPDLVAAAVELAVEHNAPMAMHLAESREEMELLATSGGPLARFLKEIDAWQADALPLGSEPFDYLRLLASAPRALVIHGNYLVDEELKFLAEHRQRMTLVYCPRTHAHFGHPRYPLVPALASGVRVALGTDSRASNPDLSLLKELRYAADVFPQIAPQQLLAMATLHGAEALGLAAELGTLEIGKRAAFTTVPLPAGESGAYSWLTS